MLTTVSYNRIFVTGIERHSQTMARLSRILILAMLVVLAVPGVASAASVTEYQLQYEPVTETGQALAIVTAIVDPQQPLPVEITIPVPAGATLLWAGEVLGGDVANDPSRTTTVERVGDMDVYTLTAEQSYTVQLEIQLPAAKVSASKVEAALTWTNPGDAVLVSASVVAEAGAGDVKTKPARAGDVRTNEAGATLYPLEGKRLGTNETYEMTVEWKRGAEGAGDAGTTSSNTLVLLVLALFASAVALIAAIRSQRTRALRAAGRVDEPE